MKPLPPPLSSSSNSWIRIAVVCGCFVVGRQIVRITNNADNPTHSSVWDTQHEPTLPTLTVDSPHPFTKGDFDRLQVGMSCPMVLSTLRLGVNSPEFAQQVALPHHVIRFIASDGQIIEIEFRKGVFKYKQLFASEAAREEDVANTRQ